jgi:hypothetical protein
MSRVSATTMPTTAAILAGDGGARRLGGAPLLILYAALLWPALAGGAHGGWPLVVTELLVLAGLLAWALGMADAGQLEWSPTALDKPLVLLFALVLLQLVIGNGPLRAWALAPPAAGPATFPARFLFLGTVSHHGVADRSGPAARQRRDGSRPRPRLSQGRRSRPRPRGVPPCPRPLPWASRGQAGRGPSRAEAVSAHA